METPCSRHVSSTQLAAALPLRSMNHISRVVSDLQKSCVFYEMLGFSRIHRPSSLRCDGVWLWGFNALGIHLIKGTPVARKPMIDPQADHISFQAESIAMTEELLKSMGVPYVEALVEEDGLLVRQLFFHDPDNNMIEICNCDVLPIVLESISNGSSDSSGSVMSTASYDSSTASSISATMIGLAMPNAVIPRSCSLMVSDSRHISGSGLPQPMDLGFA